MPNVILSDEDVLGLLQASISAAGGATAWGRKNGFSPTWLREVLVGKRPITQTLCDAIGVTRTVVFSRRALSLDELKSLSESKKRRPTKLTAWQRAQASRETAAK